MRIVLSLLSGIMMAGCSNVVPNLGFLQSPSSGGSSPEVAKPALVPSDEFISTTFDERRWTLVNLNTSMPLSKTSQGILLGGDTQNQTGANAFGLKTNYTTEIGDIYADTVIGELHIALRSPQIDQTGINVVFANGKRMVAYIYNNVYSANGSVYGRVDIYDTDSTTLIHHSVPLLLGLIGQCQEYKVAVNFNASSTAQWNVDFSDNCTSTGLVTQTALDHASLGATDYVGNSNGKARMELFGNRIPVSSDSVSDPLFGISTDGHNTPLTIDLFRTENGTLATYKVELLNWNFSTLGAKFAEVQ